MEIIQKGLENIVLYDKKEKSGNTNSEDKLPLEM